MKYSIVFGLWALLKMSLLSATSQTKIFHIIFRKWINCKQVLFEKKTVQGQDKQVKYFLPKSLDSFSEINKSLNNLFEDPKNVIGIGSLTAVNPASKYYLFESMKGKIIEESRDNYVWIDLDEWVKYSGTDSNVCFDSSSAVPIYHTFLVSQSDLKKNHALYECMKTLKAWSVPDFEPKPSKSDTYSDNLTQPRLKSGFANIKAKSKNLFVSLKDLYNEGNQVEVFNPVTFKRFKCNFDTKKHVEKGNNHDLSKAVELEIKKERCELFVLLESFLDSNRKLVIIDLNGKPESSIPIKDLACDQTITKAIYDMIEKSECVDSPVEDLVQDS